MDSKAFLKSVGAKVRAIRKAKNISQEKLAELSSLHPTYISNIEQGKVNASVYSFYKVANALRVPFAELVNISSAEMDKKVENEIAVMLSQLRTFNKRKQTIFLTAAKGLLLGIEKA
jgi:transcriptional regulator with XRE-family HTH domain